MTDPLYSRVFTGSSSKQPQWKHGTRVDTQIVSPFPADTMMPNSRHSHIIIFIRVSSSGARTSFVQHWVLKRPSTTSIYSILTNLTLSLTSKLPFQHISDVKCNTPGRKKGKAKLVHFSAVEKWTSTCFKQVHMR